MSKPTEKANKTQEPENGSWVTPQNLRCAFKDDQLSLLFQNEKSVFIPESHLKRVDKLIKSYEAEK